MISGGRKRARVAVMAALFWTTGCGLILGVDFGGAALADDAGRPAPDANADMLAPDSAGVDDLLSDRQNCGASKHDCLGAECQGGVCTARVVAKDLLADVNCFPADGDAGARCNTLLGVAVDASQLYFSVVSSISGQSLVRSCPLAACSSPASLVDHVNGQGFVNIAAVAVDTRMIYWTERGDSPGNIYDGLFNVAIAGAPCRQDVRGAAPTGCRVASVGPAPLSVVPVAGGFIVGVNDGVEVCSSAGACTPAPPSAPVSGVAASTAGVFRGTLNAIDKCGPPGVCGSTANVAKVSELQHLAADGTWLYWTTADVATSDGALLRCSLPACTDRLLLASGHGPLHGVALDAKYAYFAARSAGIIYQVAK